MRPLTADEREAYREAKAKHYKPITCPRCAKAEALAGAVEALVAHYRLLHMDMDNEYRAPDHVASDSMYLAQSFGVVEGLPLLSDLEAALAAWREGK